MSLDINIPLAKVFLVLKDAIQLTFFNYFITALVGTELLEALLIVWLLVTMPTYVINTCLLKFWMKEKSGLTQCTSSVSLNHEDFPLNGRMTQLIRLHFSFPGRIWKKNPAHFVDTEQWFCNGIVRTKVRPCSLLKLFRAIHWLHIGYPVQCLGHIQLAKLHYVISQNSSCLRILLFIFLTRPT